MKYWIACLVLFAVFLATASTAFGEKPWIEVPSPHFRVLTDGNAADARQVAREFEQIRYVFATEFPRFRLESGAPLTIFAARDGETARELNPTDWKRSGGRLTGLAYFDGDKQYAMVRMGLIQRHRLSPDGQYAEATSIAFAIYDAYTASILRLNFAWLPKWLSVGIQEFYSFTRFESDKIYVGSPPFDSPLSIQSPLSVETILSDWNKAPEYQDPIAAPRFSLDSWALVHYLTLGPGMDHGRKLSQFVTLFESGEPQKKAFQQVFGTFASIDKALDAYVRHYSFSTVVLRNPPQIDEKTFTTTKLTVGQTYAELAGYHLWTLDLKDARRLAAQALRADPRLGFAHEVQGYIFFQDGNDDAAEKEFAQAFALDPKLYLSLFAKTMLSRAATLATAADQKAFHDDMMQVADINLEFAPAYVQMARLEVRRGDLKRAYGLSRRAEELEPWRAGHRLMTAEILLRMGKGKEAAGYAAYIAKHWQGTDRDQAVELWNRVPEKERPAGVTITDENPHETQIATGRVQSVTCDNPDANGKKQHVTLTISHDGKPLTFTTGGKFEFGYSDTLWWGRDRASVCHHLDGLRAVVLYRPSPSAGYAGEIVEVSILDDLPVPQAAEGTALPQTASK